MKDRLDVTLVARGLFPSREKAKAAIMAGLVSVDGLMVDKAGTPVAEDAEISIKEDPCPYVSRGGLKLEKALETFEVDPAGLTCVDMGASTGGFTDCLLKKGAEQVFAIDVGYGQLDYSLRNDPRVVNMERTNIRYMDPDLIDPKADLVTIDVSFISTSHMFPKVVEVTKETARVLSLVKPQFEAGRDQVGKGGIVRDGKVHEEVLRKVCGYGEENGLIPAAVTYSPIKGAKGNIEYLLYLVKGEEAVPLTEEDRKAVVRQAFADLKEG